MSNQKSKTPAIGTSMKNLLILLVLGIAVTVFYQNFQENRKGIFFSKTNLEDYLNTCQQFWKDQGNDAECNLQILANPPYNFHPMPGTVIIKGGGNAETFSATAQYMDSLKSLQSVSMKDGKIIWN